MGAKSLNQIFERFAGREIEMIETPHNVTIGEKTFTQVSVRPANENDPVLADLAKTAKEHDLVLRVWWPGKAGISNQQPNRINIHIAKEADGKYRIQPRFNRG